MTMRLAECATLGMSGQPVVLNGIPLTDSHSRYQRCEARPGLIWAASRPGRGGFVLLDHACRDTPALADRDSLAFRPRPDIAAALTA